MVTFCHSYAFFIVFFCIFLLLSESSVLVQSRTYLYQCCHTLLRCMIMRRGRMMSDPTGVSQNIVLWLRAEWRAGQLLLHVPKQTAPSEDPCHKEAVWEHRRPAATHQPLQRCSTGGGGGAGERSRGSGSRGRQRGQICHLTGMCGVTVITHLLSTFVQSFLVFCLTF